MKAWTGASSPSVLRALDQPAQEARPPAPTSASIAVEDPLTELRHRRGERYRSAPMRALAAIALLVLAGCGGGASEPARERGDLDRRLIEAAFANDVDGGAAADRAGRGRQREGRHAAERVPDRDERGRATTRGCSS